MDSNNKISIVIGFGLLIFVGMFVADHFSDATHREFAILGGELPSPPPIPASQLITGQLPPLESIEHPKNATDRVHIVSKGDSLRSICRTTYGDSGLANAVALWNGLSSANRIEVGLQISLPTRLALIAAPVPSVTPEIQYTPIAKETPAAEFGTYTVKSGDTLSQIAQQICGSAKFTNKLIELNKKTLPNPDRLQIGMELRFPID
jgi:nucleoid-associated protein YgaU